jgi:hypothetical protein
MNDARYTTILRIYTLFAIFFLESVLSHDLDAVAFAANINSTAETMHQISIRSFFSRKAYDLASIRGSSSLLLSVIS